ncbi:MAG: ABC-F family ATP-binding cassette domain-containing protein [Verrucomicrobiota bacterium]
MASAAPALLSANELRVAYGHQPLLTGATLAVAAGEKVGVVGRNGSGKTTLLKILSAEEAPDSGEVVRRRGLRVGYLPQQFELNDDATVRDNIVSGAADLIEWLRCYEAGEGSDAELADLQHEIELADGWNLDARLKSIVTALFAPPLDAIVGPLSGGEKRRVALCRALVGQPDLLLLDEPTNHLDAESILWLEKFLGNFPGAVIFVTHDRYFLDVIATRIIELADGRCFSHPGNYKAYLEAKTVRQQIAEQSERRRQRFIRAELEYVRAGVRAQRSKSRHRLDTFYEVAGLEAPPEEREMDLIIPRSPEMGNTGIELVNAGARVGEGDAARWLFRKLTLSLRPGQCTGVVGRNGVGKTTLLQICLGERLPDEGTAKVGKKVVFNYIDQSRMQLDGTGTVMDEVEDTDGTVYFGGEALSVRSYLRRFLFADNRANERVDLLSGGERARLMLAKVLKRGGNILVLDEPTNDLDLASLRMLEEALVDFEGSVLVVSHDRFFLDRICDQIVAFEEDGIFVTPGNFSYYLENKQTRDENARKFSRAMEPADSNRTEPVRKPAASVRKLNFKEQRELEGVESAIHAAEAHLKSLEAQLSDPGFYVTRAVEAPQLVTQLDEAKAEVARLYSRWAELEQRPAT